MAKTAKLQRRDRRWRHTRGVVPVPLDPDDDGKVVVANGGDAAWGAMSGARTPFDAAITSGSSYDLDICDIADYVRDSVDFVSRIVRIQLAMQIEHAEGCLFDDFDIYTAWKLEKTSGVLSVTANRIRVVPNILSGGDALTSGETTVNCAGMSSSGRVVIGITDLIGSSLTSVDAYESARTKSVGTFKAGAYSGASETVVTTVTSAFDWVAHIPQKATLTQSVVSSTTLRLNIDPAAEYDSLTAYLTGWWSMEPVRRAGEIVIG